MSRRLPGHHCPVLGQLVAAETMSLPFRNRRWTRAREQGLNASSCAGREAMAEKLVGEQQPVSFGARLASSASFAGLFRDGMKLVEETASYLDGPGRKDSKK